MQANLIIGNDIDLKSYDFSNSYVIGVDKGAYIAYKNNIKLDVAIGDFDSLNDNEFNEIKSYTNIIKLNPIKDLTDTEEAINLVKDYKNINVLGGITGKRCEHFYANILLLKRYPNLRLIDNNSLIFTTNKSIKIKNDYKYISIFSLDDETILSLSGFKYNVDAYNLSLNDSLGVSNEILDIGVIDLIKGRIMIICSKDDH